MSTWLTCLHGHRWEAPTSGAGVCPVCGAAVAPPDRTEALSVAPPALAAEASGHTTAFVPPSPAPDVTETGEPPPAETLTLTPGPAGTADSQAITLPPSGPNVFQPLPAESLAVAGYEILEEIGRGGMGVVYKARQIHLRRVVALKMILAGAHAGTREMARFHREAEAVARLRHPHIVRIYDIGEHEGRPFFALEYADRGSLAQHLDGRPLPPQLAAELVEKLARAVHYAHQHHIVHRDLKPANVLLASAEPGATPAHHPLAACEPKIADFGLAKQLDTTQGQTQSGTILGTPSYMAPEQAGGKNRAIGPATDVYALGALLYELLTGRPPFLADTPVETMLLLVSKQAAAPRALVPRCPRDLETICLKCLEKEQGKRYDSAEALADDLRRFLRGESIHARRATVRERAGRWVRRHPLTTVCLLLLLGALSLVIGLYAPDLYRLTTNRGQLVLESTAPGARVHIQPENGLATTVEVGTRAALTLPAGSYTLTLSGGPEGLELSDERLTLTRNGRQVVQLRHIPEGEIRRFEGHTGAVHGLAVSPDGRLLLSCSGFPEGDATVRLWDLRTGQELRRFEGHTGQVMCVAFSPDGKRALSGSTDNTARLWDVATGQELRRFEGHTAELSSGAFSPDGRRILTGAHDSTVRLWDADSGEQLGLFDNHISMVTWATFLPDGKHIISSAHDHTVRLWELDSGIEVRRFEANGQATECVAVSPDGRLAAAPGYDTCIRLWDVTTGRLVRRFLGHTSVIGTLAFSPDGRHLVSGSMDRTVRLWDVASGAELHCFEGHADGIRAVAFTPDGHRILSGGGGNWEKKWTPGNDFAIRLWGLPHSLAPPSGPSSAPAVEVRRFEGHATGVDGAVVSPDGRFLVSSGRDGTLRLWDLESGQERGRLVGHSGEVWGLAWSADGRHIVTGGDDGSVRLWDARTGEQRLHCPGHQGRVWSVVLSADGRRALSGGQDRTIRLWDLTTGQELRRFTGLQTEARRVALAPDGRSAISCGSNDKVLRRWDLRDVPDSGIGAPRKLAALLAAGPSPLAAAAVPYLGRVEVLDREPGLLEGHTAGVQSVLFSPDGRRILSGGHDRTIRIWDAATGKEERKFEGHTQAVEDIVLSADGKRVLSSGWDGVALCWELDSGRELGFCAAHPGIITGIAFAPGDRFLTTGHHDPVVRLWQLAAPDRPAPPSLPVPPETAPERAPGEVARFTGHRDPITCVAVAPDGRRVLTGSGTKFADGKYYRGAENELRLWDARTGRELRRFRGHTGAIFRIVFSRDGRQALSGSADGTLRLWDLETGKEVRTYRGVGEVRGLAWSADGRRIVCGSVDGVVHVFDAATAQTLRRFPIDNGAVWSLALSPDGRQLAAGKARVVQLGEVESGRWLRTFTGHNDVVRDVFFSADGSRLFSGGPDATIRQWDVASGQPLGGLLRQESGIICTAVAPDGRHAATGAWDGRVRLWDLQEGRELHTFTGHAPMTHSVAFTPDGKHVVSGGYDRTARLWQLPDKKPIAGKEPGQLLLAAAHPGAELIVKRDGKIVVPRTARRRLELPPGRYEVELADPAEDLRIAPKWVTIAAGEQQEVKVRRVRVTLKSPEHVGRLEGHGGKIRRLAVSPDGRLALSGSGWNGDGTARLWDVATRKELRRLEGHCGQVFGVAFSADGRQALTGGEDHTARLWDVRTGRQLLTLNGHTGGVWYVDLDRQGRRALTCGDDRTVRIWEVTTGKQLHVLSHHTQAVEAAVFSPDGKNLLSTSQDKTIRLWETVSGREIALLTVDGSFCNTVAFSPDGRQALAACTDSYLHLWELDGKKEVRRFRGHTGAAFVAVFTADSRGILSGGLDGTVRLWDVETATELRCLRGHTDGVLALAVTPDGRHVLSAGGIISSPTGWGAGDDFDIHLWALPARGP
ncbi:MAG TPA: protein kinase [Gemmataceae bacterium]|jgi:WD40 repeat protein/tRNA A-37 threonylcarbamoyl transferase component Bud32